MDVAQDTAGVPIAHVGDDYAVGVEAGMFGFGEVLDVTYVMEAEFIDIDSEDLSGGCCIRGGASSIVVDDEVEVDAGFAVRVAEGVEVVAAVTEVDGTEMKAGAVEREFFEAAGDPVAVIDGVVGWGDEFYFIENDVAERTCV